ncbi:MAG: ABC transporter substrate-binding protein [Actinobacteria bacterium]|nr:ABC transporter substrate-binding protein [Actinomycetota bacterium]
MKSSRAWKARPACLSALAVLAVLVAGCGGGGTSGSGGGGTAGGEPAAGTTVSESSAEPQAGGTLSVSLGEEIIGLNPLTNISFEDVNVMSQMFETLFKEDYEGEVVPWLLESFKPSKNYTVWTMELKKGVDFSTGKPMTSADVQWSLEQDMESESHAGIVEGWKKVEATSPTTVVLTTKAPTPEMPTILSQWIFSVLPKDFEGKSEKEFFEHPVGTGPFEFVSWKKGESITLRKNANYWMPDRPYLDEIVYHTVQSPESRTAQVRGGQLDVAYAPPFPEIESLEQSPELAVEAPFVGTSWFIILNTQSDLFKNRKAREAVNYALDREAMIDLALHGNGEPMNSQLMPWVPGYDKSLPAPEFNAETAKELLAEAVQEGVKPTFTLLTLAESPFWTQGVQIAQANLEEVGFTVTIKKSDLSSLLGQLEEGSFDASTIYNVEQSQSPNEFFSFYNATGGIFSGVNTERTTKQMVAAQSETNTAKRKAMWSQMQKQVNEETSLIMAAYSPYVWVRQGDLSGVFAGKTGILWLGEAGFGG